MLAFVGAVLTPAGSIEDVNAATEPVPCFTIGAGYAVYRGRTTDSGIHRHAAFQIAIAVQGEVAMVDASATHHRAVALVVAPMARHRMLAAASLLTFFVEPHSVFADRLRKRYADGITAAPELYDLREKDVGPASVCPSSELDPRLMEAMNTLRDRSVSMPSLAATVGLSPQRLRTLAQHQLGMPLTRWRVWARLGRAAEALRAGQPPADAAITAGFADQAHLTRRMREMVGLTPAAVLPMLRDHSRRAT